MLYVKMGSLADIVTTRKDSRGSGLEKAHQQLTGQQENLKNKKLAKYLIVPARRDCRQWGPY